MEVNKKNPYKKNSAYAKGFDFICKQKNQIVTRSQLVFFYKELNCSFDSAIVCATVLLSPRIKDSERGKKDSCLGNYSSKGEVYYMEPLKGKGEKCFKLHWRKESVTEVKKDIWEGKIEDEESSSFKFFDSDKQTLYFRVGPVFFPGGKEQIGLWVEYEDTATKEGYKGPLLMSERVWEELKKRVDKGFEDAKNPPPCPY